MALVEQHKAEVQREKDAGHAWSPRLQRSSPKKLPPPPPPPPSPPPPPNVFRKPDRSHEARMHLRTTKRDGGWRTTRDPKRGVCVCVCVCVCVSLSPILSLALSLALSLFLFLSLSFCLSLSLSFRGWCTPRASLILVTVSTFETRTTNEALKVTIVASMP